MNFSSMADAFKYVITLNIAQANPTHKGTSPVLDFYDILQA